MTQNNFSSATRLSLKIIREKWFTLLLLFVLSSWVGIQMEDALVDVGSKDDTSRILFAIIGALADLCEGIFLLFIVSWAIPKVHPLNHPKFLKEPFNRPYISTFFAEYLRVLGQVLLWTVALLIPGLVRYIQLSLVPLIVFFSREYEEGEIDAVALSTQIVNRRWKLVYGVMIFSILASMALQLAPSHWEELHTLPVRMTFYFLGSLLSIWTYCLIFLVFEQEMKK